MKKSYFVFFLVIINCLSFSTTFAQKNREKRAERFTLTGVVKDEDGLPIPGANVSIPEMRKGTTTDNNGFFLMELPKDFYNLRVSFLGFYTSVRRVELMNHLRIDIQLVKEVKELKEVEITGENRDKNVQSTQQGTSRMTITAIKKLPTLLGEIDVIRSLQTLPGIATVGEGANGFNVRGGNSDQNLILMDDIPVFNTAHLMGFFSIFNPDAVRDMTIYRGGIPPQYGGRTSSVLDIKLKEPNWDSLRIFGGMSLLSSRIGTEIPLIKQKMSLMLAGRLSYTNYVFQFFENKAIANTRSNFNDLTGKFRWRINDKNHLYLTSYVSNDDFKVSGDSLAGIEVNATSTLFKWQSRAAGMRWNKIWTNNLFSNTSVIYSRYAPSMEIPDTAYAAELLSNIEHRQIKSDFKFIKNKKHAWDFGISAIHYKLKSGSLLPTHSSSNISSIVVPDESALEMAAYWGDEYKVNKNLTINYGLRYSAFALLGPGRVLHYEEGFAKEPFTVLDSTVYSSGIIKTYQNIEPRLSVKMNVGTEGSIKLGYQRLPQYVHLISNTTSALPTARWKMSDTYIKPQVADQISIGYFKNFDENTIETSVEAYYKNTANFPDYRSGQNLLLKEDIETALLQGKGRSYGLEMYARKKAGRVTGWLTYTFSRSQVQIYSPYPEDKSFSGQWYPTNFDKPHVMNIILNYYSSRSLNFTANFTYGTGRPASFASDKYFYDYKFIPHFPFRNLDRIPDYHRLDLSMNIETFTNKKTKAESQWNFSIYNVYGRKNPYSVFFKTKSSNASQGLNAAFAYRFAVLGAIIPSITWNFKW